MKQRVLTLVFDKDEELAALREILRTSYPVTPFAKAILKSLEEAVNYDSAEPSGVREFPRA